MHVLNILVEAPSEWLGNETRSRLVECRHTQSPRAILNNDASGQLLEPGKAGQNLSPRALTSNDIGVVENEAVRQNGGVMHQWARN
jgi:hypothetical protein